MLHGFNFSKLVFFVNTSFYVLVILSSNSHIPQYQGPRAPTRGRPRGGNAPGSALLVKRRNSKWFFTNEPEVRFRFRFWLS